MCSGGWCGDGDVGGHESGSHQESAIRLGRMLTQRFSENKTQS